MGVKKVSKTPDEIIEWVCKRFKEARCLEDLEMQKYFLECDSKHGHEYTLAEGALDKMRAAYKKRLDELKGKS
jgi:hypothetical protein